MKKIKDALEKDIPARRLEYTEDEEKVIKSFNLLTKALFNAKTLSLRLILNE